MISTLISMFRKKLYLSIPFLFYSSIVNAYNCGEFTPLADSGTPFPRVHFFPKKCNKVIISGKKEIIPQGVGVISGGVIGKYNDASIDKTEHQVLKGNTLYYVYVYMKNNKMLMDFSLIGHKESPLYGNEVHLNDESRSLVGMVYTTKEGMFLGSNRSQLTLSWFNRGHTGIIQQLEGQNTDSLNTKEVSKNNRLEWLQWGINNSFKQGFTVPNIYVQATVQNLKENCSVQISLGLDSDRGGSFNGTYTQISPIAYGFLGATIVGANGTNEGYHFASFLMSTAGTCGTAIVRSGAIYSSPLES